MANADIKSTIDPQKIFDGGYTISPNAVDGVVIYQLRGSMHLLFTASGADFHQPGETIHTTAAHFVVALDRVAEIGNMLIEAVSAATGEALTPAGRRRDNILRLAAAEPTGKAN
jgi:hypothetical protein